MSIVAVTGVWCRVAGPCPHGLSVVLGAAGAASADSRNAAWRVARRRGRGPAVIIGRLVLPKRARIGDCTYTNAHIAHRTSVPAATVHRTAAYRRGAGDRGCPAHDAVEREAVRNSTPARNTFSGGTRARRADLCERAGTWAGSIWEDARVAAGRLPYLAGNAQAACREPRPG